MARGGSARSWRPGHGASCVCAREQLGRAAGQGLWNRGCGTGLQDRSCRAGAAGQELQGCKTGAAGQGLQGCDCRTGLQDRGCKAGAAGLWLQDRGCRLRSPHTHALMDPLQFVPVLLICSGTSGFHQGNGTDPANIAEESRCRVHPSHLCHEGVKQQQLTKRDANIIKPLILILFLAFSSNCIIGKMHRNFCDSHSARFHLGWGSLMVF